MVTSGQAGEQGLVVVEPVEPLIAELTAWTAKVQGSSLVWDPATHVLTYRPPSRSADDGWSLVVDEAAPPMLVRVRGELPYLLLGFSVTPLVVDVWVFVDASGEVLGRGIESGATETFPGWFRASAMDGLAEAMGVDTRDDHVVTWRDLNTRYAGLVPSSRTYAIAARANGLTTMILSAVFFVVGAVGVGAAVATGTPGAAVAAFLGGTAIGAALAVQGRRLLAAVGRRAR